MRKEDLGIAVRLEVVATQLQPPHLAEQLSGLVQHLKLLCRQSERHVGAMAVGVCDEVFLRSITSSSRPYPLLHACSEVWLAPPQLVTLECSHTEQCARQGNLGIMG